MATPPSLTHIAFAAGLDESQEDEILDPNTGFLVLSNVRQDRKGGMSKRLGFGSLTRTRLGTSDRIAGYRLFSHLGRPCVIDGQYIDSYVETHNTNISITRVPECAYDLIDLPTPAPHAIVDDSEFCNGYIALSSRADNIDRIANVAILDAATGASVIPATVLDTGGDAIIRLASFSSRYFMAFLLRLDTHNLYAYKFDTQSPTSGWSLVATVATGTSSDNIFSCCSLSDRAVVAYATTSGTSRVSVKTVGLSAVIDSTTINTSSTTPGPLDVHGGATGTIWVTWSEGAAAKACGLSAPGLATTSTTATVYTDADPIAGVRVCEGASSDTARMFAITVSQATVLADLLTVAGATTTPNSTVKVQNARAFSRPFLRNGRYYVACFSAGDPNNSQSLLLVVDWTDNVEWLRPVANIEPGLVTNAGDSFSGKFWALDSNTWNYAFQLTKAGRSGFFGVEFGESVNGFKLLRLDFASRHNWQSVSRPDGVFLGGAVATVYDGEYANEIGFLVRPLKVTTQSVSPSGGGITGTFKYAAIYESADATGNWVVSGVSIASEPATPSSQDVNVSVVPLTITTRPNSTSVAIYRTADGGEPPYYRIGNIANDLSSETMVFVDDVPNATAITKAQLYAPSLPGVNGSSQDRRAPPGLTYLCSYNGMLVGTVGNTLWYSGQRVEGEAIWFSPIFQVPFEDHITGLASQDGTLYAFARRSVYAITGEAPSDNGSSGGLGTPRRLATDVGCIDACSILVTSMGIFFQSERGIEILSRGGQVSWIGERIQRTLADFPVVSSAVIDDHNSLVRFSLAESESGGQISGNGRDLVFDLSLQQWVSVDDKEGSTAHASSQDASIVTISGVPRYAWLSTSGVVYYERQHSDADAYLDGTTWITMAAETSWFKLSGLQGRQVLNHALALARKHTDHDLSVSLAYNYETSFRSARTWTRDFINSLLLNGWPITQLKHEPHDDNRCQSFRLRIEDVTPSTGTVGSGRGATWLGLTFDVTPEPGIFDVPEEAA